MKKWTERLVLFVVGIVVTFLLYVIFVILPVLLYAETKCLKAGYPNTHVTIGLEIYCSNLTGSVTIFVDKLK